MQFRTNLSSRIAHRISWHHRFEMEIILLNKGCKISLNNSYADCECSFISQSKHCSPHFLFVVLKDKGYTTLQDEAIKIFNSLQQLESMSDPIPIIQGILQTGHDLRPLRDELYCQLIKQTNKVPNPGSMGNLYSWQILTCMSCTFLPSRSILKYLKFHLKRWGAFNWRPRKKVHCFFPHNA